jgi:uncharacterized protein YbcI
VRGSNVVGANPVRGRRWTVDATYHSSTLAPIWGERCADPCERRLRGRVGNFAAGEVRIAPALTDSAPTSPDTNHEVSTLQAISHEMVRLFKEQFGRGPTRARAEWAGPDAVMVILEDTLTPAERNLAALGQHERLRETRMFFQYASVREFCEPIERLTGRKVRAFISGVDTEVNGLACEPLLLHPPGSDEPSRIEAADL